jgi:hypothetical protein
VLTVIALDGKPKLPEIVGALRASSRGARGLHRGQKQTEENSDDGNYYQQLDQREPAHAGGAQRLES